MIKIFTPNKDVKIELTKEELEDLLREARREGSIEERERCKDASDISNIDPYKPFRDPYKMFYVDPDSLPKYNDDLYEKAPYWMNPKFNFSPNWTCDTTACPSPDLETKYTTCCTNPNKCTTTVYNKSKKHKDYNEYFGEDLNK